MSTLWLVRHGPTHAKAMIGWTDLPADLSDSAALARLANHLPHAPVISSDLSRAITTADAIQGNRPRLPHDSALREMHFGAWEARTWAEVNDETPAPLRAFWEQPGDTAPPNGESWNALSTRVSTAIDRLLAEQHNGLIIVCHFGAILTQLQRALGVSTTEVFSHTIDNLSVTQITTTPWAAVSINHSP